MRDIASITHPTYQAWFDTGGSESDPNILVAVGLITTEEKRRRFDARWNAVLAHHGVTQLHMFEFAHFKKEFADWNGDEPRRSAFLTDLIAVIKRGINKTYVTGVVLPDFVR